ncbi:MAG: PAS domain S-box protein [Proteobacteria bacterium]|nr:PAS domain S-box protein [Pseudomonadota bacterium]
MERSLRILILEDLPSDAELMVYELRQAEIAHSYRRVADREHFVAALAEDWPDLILSDFHLPNFDGLEALALAQATCPDKPFIFVSGAMGEEVAIDAVQRGATDYVLKDRLSRLARAVQRALREAEERQERRQAEAALKASEEKYRLLVKNLPGVVYKGYVDCAVDFIDEKVEELTSYPKREFDTRNMKWHDILVTEDYQQFKTAFQRGLKESGSYIREYRIRRKDGEVIWIQDRGQIICGPGGQVEYISGVFFDITERRRAEEALRESEARFASFMRHLPGTAVMRDFKGRYLFANEAWERIQRRPRQDWQGKTIAEVWPPETAASINDSDQQVITQGEPVQTIVEILQEDGIHNWLINKFPIPDKDGRPALIGAVGIDITLRRRAEEALRESEQRLRFLTSQLLSAQERERKRISMELHDELGQSLAVLKLQIRAIERGLGDDQQDLKAECVELLLYLDGVIDDIRRLSRDLSPAIIEDLGLQSALKYLINGVSKHYTVSQAFEVEDLDQLFPAEAQIIIYRIFQECLTNISKHADATEVSIAVKEHDGLISLMIEDNGAGFDPALVLARRATGRGLGLAALDERARMLGGTLEIRSQPGAGTRMTCVIPVDQGRKAIGN